MDIKLKYAIRQAILNACEGKVNDRCVMISAAVAKVFNGTVVQGSIDLGEDSFSLHYWNYFPNTEEELDFSSQQFGGNGMDPIANRTIWKTINRPAMWNNEQTIALWKRLLNELRIVRNKRDNNEL